MKKPASIIEYYAGETMSSCLAKLEGHSEYFILIAHSTISPMGKSWDDHLAAQRKWVDVYGCTKVFVSTKGGNPSASQFASINKVMPKGWGKSSKVLVYCPLKDFSFNYFVHTSALRFLRLADIKLVDTELEALKELGVPSTDLALETIRYCQARLEEEMLEAQKLKERFSLSSLPPLVNLEAISYPQEKSREGLAKRK